MKNKILRNLGIAGILAGGMALSTIIALYEKPRKLVEQKVLTNDNTINVNVAYQNNTLDVCLKNKTDFKGAYSWDLSKETANSIDQINGGSYMQDNKVENEIHLGFTINDPGTYYFILSYQALNTTELTEGNKQEFRIE